MMRGRLYRTKTFVAALAILPALVVTVDIAGAGPAHASTGLNCTARLDTVNRTKVTGTPWYYFRVTGTASCPASTRGYGVLGGSHNAGSEGGSCVGFTSCIVAGEVYVTSGHCATWAVLAEDPTGKAGPGVSPQEYLCAP